MSANCQRSALKWEMDATRRGENCSAKMEIVLIFEIQLLVVAVVVVGVFLNYSCLPGVR